MANTGLEGPFPLTNVKIDAMITRTSPGVYVLGTVRADGVFVVNYVGRSDTDLNQRLHTWVGKKAYTHFKASYFSTAQEAFDKECSVYHDFGGVKSDLDNDIHPDRPTNHRSTCQRCYIFD